MTALLLEMSIFCVTAGCEIWLSSCGSKHASESLFDTPLVHTYTHKLKTTGHIYATALLLEAFFVWFRFSWEILTGELPPDTHQSFSDTTLCMYILQARTYITIWVCNYAWQQNSHTLWLHTTHQMTALLPRIYRFIRTKLDSYSTHCSLFN